jgi:hypothetical protein
MSSKSSRSSNKRHVKFGPGNPSQKNPGKGGPNPQNKGQRKYDRLRTTSPGHKQRRTPERQRKIPGSGVTSIRAPGITLLIVHSKKSLVAEVKASESDVGSNSESEPERGRQIIDAEPSATISTTKLQPGEPDKPEEGEHLFHSQMWVKGTPLHFIIDSGSQKNLISVEVVK